MKGVGFIVGLGFSFFGSRVLRGGAAGAAKAFRSTALRVRMWVLGLGCRV